MSKGHSQLEVWIHDFARPVNSTSVGGSTIKANNIAADRTGQGTSSRMNVMATPMQGVDVPDDAPPSRANLVSSLAASLTAATVSSKPEKDFELLKQLR